MIAKMKARGARCSFCGRSGGEVAKMVAGTPQHSKATAGKSAVICNECVQRYRALIANQETTNPSLIVPK